MSGERPQAGSRTHRPGGPRCPRPVGRRRVPQHQCPHRATPTSSPRRRRSNAEESRTLTQTRPTTNQLTPNSHGPGPKENRRPCDLRPLTHGQHPSGRCDQPRRRKDSAGRAVRRISPGGSARILTRVFCAKPVPSVPCDPATSRAFGNQSELGLPYQRRTVAASVRRTVTSEFGATGTTRAGMARDRTWEPSPAYADASVPPPRSYR